MLTGPPDRRDASAVMAGRNASMTMLVEKLADVVGHPVSDETGITKAFDFRLDYAAEDAVSDSAPSILAAIQVEFGLKLKPRKGLVETLFIDHAEKSSNN
jgi:uncharacterized protein (TIGR03435 family)